MSGRFTTDSAEEKLVLTTKKGRYVGLATRKDCHKGKGKTHWGLLAIIKRPDGRIVLAKRSLTKSVFADVWDASVATHVLPGDTPEEASRRETKEELDINVNYKRIGDFFYTASDNDYAENEYCTVLLGVSYQTIKPHSREVSDIKEISLIDLIKNIKNSPNDYSPWMKIAIKKYRSILSHG